MEEGIEVTPTNLAENAIIFNVTGLDVPVLELRQNGDIMVKGNLVEKTIHTEAVKLLSNEIKSLCWLERQ